VERVSAEREKLSRDEKLSQRCEVLADVVTALRRLYPSATQTQKELLETIIGAAIWYLPECDGLFSGKMSAKALEECTRDPKQWAKLTKEHFYPRKQAGADLLKDDETRWNREMILDGFRTKWGRYHRVTKAENRALVSSQRKKLMEAEDCYRGARIDLVDVPPQLMNRRSKKKAS
jgi:hypothetical protein